MKTSLDLMKAFTSNRKPYRTYSPSECLRGSEYILSEKQSKWLSDVIAREMAGKEWPKGWAPCMGTTMTECSTHYTFTTIGKRRQRQVVRVGIY